MLRSSSWISLEPKMPSHCFRLLLVALMLTLTPTTACPEFCVCFDGTFVTCSNFKLLDLTLLPAEIDTLSLSTGEVDELTPGFLAMATSLKVLEITSVHVRVVRGGAFRGLSNLERFAISDSTFDIVEPDSFSGLSDIQELLISQCRFGRVGKHAFSYVTGILKFAIWSSSFEAISEEAFYQMSAVLLFRVYKNNITSMGKDVFAGVDEIDDVNIHNNKIDHMAEGSLETLVDTASRFLFYDNVFICSCDLAWVFTRQMQEYHSTNRCVFRDRTYVLSDLNLSDICVTSDQSESTTDATESPLIHDDKISRIEDSENGYEDTATQAPLKTTTAGSVRNSFIDEFLIIENVDLDNLPTQKADTNVDDNTESNRDYNTDTKVVDDITDTTVIHDIYTQAVTTETLNNVNEVDTSESEPTQIELERTQFIYPGIQVNNANFLPTEKIITVEERHLSKNDYSEDDTSELFTSLSTTTESLSQSKEISYEEDSIPPSSHLPLDRDTSDTIHDSNTKLRHEDAISTEDSVESARSDTSYVVSGEWDDDQDDSQTDPTRYDAAKDNVALAVSDPVDEGDAHEGMSKSEKSERRTKGNPNNSAERDVARIASVMAVFCCLLRFLDR